MGMFIANGEFFSQHHYSDFSEDFSTLWLEARGGLSSLVAARIALPKVLSMRSGAFLPLLMMEALNFLFPRGSCFFIQHCLYFFPEPQGQGSLRPIFSVTIRYSLV